MSKNRKERKVNSLNALADVVDVANLPEAAPAEGAQEVAQDAAEVMQTMAEDLGMVDAAAPMPEPEVPQAEEPVAAPVEEPKQQETEQPAEAKPNSEIPAEALKIIEDLTAKIAALKSAKATKKVASGSKARPNVVYTLLKKPPAWHGTPQVAQLQQILFSEDFLASHKQDDGTVKVAEPELFAAVKAGYESGVLRTRQNPVRIFQYYRSDLLNADCLRWE